MIKLHNFVLISYIVIVSERLVFVDIKQYDSNNSQNIYLTL